MSDLRPTHLVLLYVLAGFIGGIVGHLFYINSTIHTTYIKDRVKMQEAIQLVEDYENVIKEVKEVNDETKRILGK